MPSIAVKRRQLHHPEARPTIGDFAVGRLARKLAMEGPPISVDPYRCEAESAPNPATIRNSTLLLPAIAKMLPCSIRACPKILPAPWIARSHYNILKSYGNSVSEDRLSLQFLKISLQIGKLQGDGPRDRFASDCILSHAVGLSASLLVSAGGAFRPAMPDRLSKAKSSATCQSSKP
jgi:hypothetical protein